MEAENFWSIATGKTQRENENFMLETVMIAVCAFGGAMTGIMLCMLAAMQGIEESLKGDDK